MPELKQMLDDIMPEIIKTGKKNPEIIKDIDPIYIMTLLSPGQELRKGLEEILNGQLGGLIVLGTNIVLESIIRGGYKLDVAFTPQRLFELAKMDGAIIVSNDLKKIVYANVHLMPDKTISSTETGIRHRSAEQATKQTGLPVIAISHRRKVITLFYKDLKYVFKDINILLAKANYSIRSLHSYKTQIDDGLQELTYYELNNSASFEDVIKIIQKIIFMYKHQLELQNIIIELGDEGKEIKQTLLEYTHGIEDTLKLLIMDYCKEDGFYVKDFIETLKTMDANELSDIKNIALDMGLEKGKSIDDIHSPRGYRILSQIPKLSKSTIENVIKAKETLINIFISNEEELIKDANIPENQARILKDRLTKINDANLNKISKV